MRDSEQGYFSAAVIDFDGNSIEAVNRPGKSSGRRDSSDRALTVVENGSVVSRNSSVRTSTKSRSVVARSEMGGGGGGGGSVAGSVARGGGSSPSVVTSYKPGPAFQAQAKPYPEPQPQYQQPRSQGQAQGQGQQATVPYMEKKTDENGLSGAKAVVGTLLGAAAGAAIAYAMVKDSSSSSSDPMPPPQYSEQAGAPRGLGEAGEYNTPDQAAASAYRAIEAGPLGNDDTLSSFARNQFSRNPHATTILDGITQCSRALGQAQTQTPRGGSEIEMGRRQSADSVYGMPPLHHHHHHQYDPDTNGDLPTIRAIEGIPPAGEEYREASVYSRSYPYNPSTFISEFTERPARRRDHDAATSIYYTKSTASSSASTAKPPSHYHKSSSSRSHSHASKNGGGASSEIFSIDEMYPSNMSGASSNRSKSTTTTTTARSARNIPLPHGSSVAPSSYSKSSSRHPKSTASSSSSRVSAHNVPLPASVASASPSTIFLGGGVDVDSHVTPTQSTVDRDRERGGGSGGSKASRASTVKKASTFSHSPVSEHSRRSSTSRRSSKFEEPVRPSDSVSQVSTNVSKRSSKSRKSSYD